LKKLQGNPVPVEVRWQNLVILSACKKLGAHHHLGAKIWSSEKGTSGGYYLTVRFPWLLD